MDTRKIHDMAIFPTTVLMKVYNIPKDDDKKKSKLNPRYPISEYLFYGPIRNSPNDPCYRAVHWDSLYNADTCGSLESFWSRDIRDTQLHFRIERERLRRESQQSDFASIFPTIVLISALFGREFQVTMIIAFLSLLCGPLTPSADELGLKFSYLQLPRPFDPDSIIDFNFSTNVDPTLSEVARFCEGLRTVLEGSLRRERELAETFGRLSITG
ncbi:hypothetical protein M409DRAFT_25817 [Zasmidium cellare ATCC 36951]|uniref:Uncharacterized protein n=1 Tax=Zasmidium cellare ATCC 36951 TaxID=1080233 RepID=A0A6A6CCZ4_ZASCE|nr:uncharacterized protein M409DRAFT_25817 [Zasmidium cellare ATCC 36951]KAF2164048.1 hypothetical protein M409DRAFT_25817 [Zasmidium cellare ATCC 36951]